MNEKIVFLGDCSPLYGNRIAAFSEEDIKNRLNNIEEKINQANIICVFINGDYFRFNHHNNICRSIKRNFALFVTPYLSNYSEHNVYQHGRTPDVIFVVTKCIWNCQEMCSRRKPKI